MDRFLDYLYLEKSLEKVDAIKKQNNRPLDQGIENLNASSSKKFQMACKKRNITLDLMPNNFERHRINKSHVQTLSDAIIWTVEIIASENDTHPTLIE